MISANDNIYREATVAFNISLNASPSPKLRLSSRPEYLLKKSEFVEMILSKRVLRIGGACIEIVFEINSRLWLKTSYIAHFIETNFIETDCNPIKKQQHKTNEANHYKNKSQIVISTEFGFELDGVLKMRCMLSEGIITTSAKLHTRMRKASEISFRNHLYSIKTNAMPAKWEGELRRRRQQQYWDGERERERKSERELAIGMHEINCMFCSSMTKMVSFFILPVGFFFQSHCSLHLE